MDKGKRSRILLVLVIVMGIILTFFIGGVVAIIVFRVNPVDYFDSLRIQQDILTAEEIFEMASPATVEITINLADECGTSTGAGFFIEEDIVVTNYHVIDYGESGYISRKNNERFKVIDVVSYDKEADIALLRVDYKSPICLAVNTNSVKTGQTIYALGSSVGLSESFSDGVVSQANRLIEGKSLIQISAPISPGNSGGPLLNTSGEVVGINCAGIDYGQNVNFAIPIAKALDLPRNQNRTLDGVRQKEYAYETEYEPGNWEPSKPEKSYEDFKEELKENEENKEKKDFNEFKKKLGLD